MEEKRGKGHRGKELRTDITSFNALNGSKVPTTKEGREKGFPLDERKWLVREVVSTLR